MRYPLTLFFTALCCLCAPTFAQYINFSGISAASLPQTFNFGTGTVTVSEVSAPAVGTASLAQYLPNPGQNGYDSPTGGLKQAILDTGTGPDSWELKFAFSQVETLSVHNLETYCNFENTTLQSDNAWTQVQSASPNLLVNGLGTSSISMVGANSANGPFGYGYWSTTTANLFMTYTLNETAGGSAGNGLAIAVPEPASLSLTALLCAATLPRRRSRTRENHTRPSPRLLWTFPISSLTMTTKNLTLTLLSLMIASTFPSRARAAVTTLSMPGATDVSFGYDDTLYATAGASILRYSTQTKSFLPSWTLGGSLLGIDLSPDGKTLAVADNSNANGLDGVDLVNTTTGQSQRITFPLQSLENGTFMVAWGANNQLLITSTFNGSGEVPLRDYNPSTNSVTTLTNVQQDTMLTPSADRQTIALAQSNDSGGPVGFYNVQSASLNPGTNTNWFVFEIAVNNNGTQFAVPSYDGTFVYDRNWNLLTTLGTYASSSPIAAVYSPDDSVLYTAWYDYNTANAGVKAYSTSTWKLLQTFDTYNFPWTGNFALDAGRMDVSPDGNFLAVTVSGGVQLINLPEPITIAPITAAAVLLRRRRRPTTLHPPAIQS